MIIIEVLIETLAIILAALLVFTTLRGGVRVAGKLSAAIPHRSARELAQLRQHTFDLRNLFR